MSHTTGSEATSQLALEDQIALRLGRMTMRFAAVESTTRYVTRRVLDVSDEDQAKIDAVLAELPFRKLRATLLAAVRDSLGDGEELQTLRSLLRDVERVEERRNVLTHSSWNYSQLPEQIAREKVRVSSSGAFRADQEVFADLAELDAFVREIHQLGAALFQWYMIAYLGVVPDAAQRGVEAAE